MTVGDRVDRLQNSGGRLEPFFAQCVPFATAWHGEGDERQLPRLLCRGRRRWTLNAQQTRQIARPSSQSRLRAVWPVEEAKQNSIYAATLHSCKAQPQVRVSPTFCTLFFAESFIGAISRIDRICHGSTVSQRVLQRHFAKFQLLIRHKKREQEAQR